METITAEDIRFAAGAARIAVEKALKREAFGVPMPIVQYQQAVSTGLALLQSRMELLCDGDVLALESIAETCGSAYEHLSNPLADLDEVLRCIGDDWSGAAAESFKAFFRPFERIRANQAAAARALKGLAQAAQEILYIGRRDAIEVCNALMVAGREFSNFNGANLKVALAAGAAATGIGAAVATGGASGALTLTVFSQLGSLSGASIDQISDGASVAALVTAALKSLDTVLRALEEASGRVLARADADLAEISRTASWQGRTSSVVEPPRPDLFVGSANGGDWGSLRPPGRIGTPKVPITP